MRNFFVISIFLTIMATVSGCDAGHGHSHDDQSPSHHHKSID
jgi:hypothetical protein